MQWNEEHTVVMRDYDTAHFTMWIKDGLEKWSVPQEVFLAFKPVSDRFDSTDEIEPQLIDMAQALPHELRIQFLAALITLRKEAEVAGDEWLYLSMEYAITLAKGRGMLS